MDPPHAWTCCRTASCLFLVVAKARMFIFHLGTRSTLMLPTMAASRTPDTFCRTHVPVLPVGVAELCLKRDHGGIFAHHACSKPTFSNAAAFLGCRSVSTFYVRADDDFGSIYCDRRLLFIALFHLVKQQPASSRIFLCTTLPHEARAGRRAIVLAACRHCTSSTRCLPAGCQLHALRRTCGMIRVLPV